MGACLENFQLVCAVCRIGVYSIFRRLCCKSPPPPRPDYNVVCVGLTEAGKSTMLAKMSGENDEITPTSGFVIKAVQFKTCILNIKELGGSDKIRPYWKHYYKDTEGVIFVFDSACSEEELENVKTSLNEVLSTPNLNSLPCLILANCQDKNGARSESEVREALDLDVACSGRQWALSVCSSNWNAMKIRECFEKFNSFLLVPRDGEIDNKPGVNRI